MTQGIFVYGRRPNSKKEIKEAVKSSPSRVRLQATGMRDEYDGVVVNMPEDRYIAFVGPDPYNNRKFYGLIRRTGDKIEVK